MQFARERSGYFYGFAAYLWWGAFPWYFSLMDAVNPFEIVPWRVVTALVFCGAVMLVMRRAATELRTMLRTPKQLLGLAATSIFLYANWQIFVFGVSTGHIIECALGYFINPILTILVGVLWRGEKLSRLQTVAVCIAAVGVTVSAIAYGQFPWIALGVAVSFTLYGAVRKMLSVHTSAITALTVETMWATLWAGTQVVLMAILGATVTAFSDGPVTIALVLGSGVMTAVPLLLFAAATKRLPLSHLGFLQFMTPILGFLTGWLVYGEPMPLARWIGFIAVAVAAWVLMSESIHASWRNRRLARVSASRVI